MDNNSNELTVRKREAISAAVQLHYTRIDKNVISKISRATNEAQISNILVNCRHKIDTL